MEALDKAHEFLSECETYQIQLEKYDALEKKHGTEPPTKPTLEYQFNGKSIFAFVLETLK